MALVADCTKSTQYSVTSHITAYAMLSVPHHHPKLNLAVLLSGNALASINVVALRQTRLVPRWTTVCGRVNHLGMKPANQIDSAFYPPRGGKMSVSFLAE